MSNMGKLGLARKSEADERFSSYEFIREVKDSSRWGIEGDDWVRVVYLENGDEPSEKIFFAVKFAPGSDQVLSAEVLH